MTTHANSGKVVSFARFPAVPPTGLHAMQLGDLVAISDMKFGETVAANPLLQSQKTLQASFSAFSCFEKEK